MPVGIVVMILAIFVSSWIINVTLAAIEGSLVESLLNWISHAYLWLAGIAVFLTIVVTASKR